jgi:hypothetical protein
VDAVEQHALLAVASDLGGQLAQVSERIQS